MSRRISCAATMLALAVTAQPVLAAPPAPLAPSTPWNMHYADDSCRLAREFGTEDEKVTLLLDQYAPGSDFDISVLGKPTAKLAKATGTAKAGFGPGLPLEEKKRLLAGTSGTNTPIIFVGRLDILNREKDDAGMPAPAAAIAKVREFHVAKGSTGLTLQLGAMPAALKAISVCTADLVKLWGLDPAQQANLASRPTPVGSPGDWLRPGDYPTNSASKGEQALIHFRLMVDAEGKPTQCAIQTATQTPQIKALTCQLMMKRARFTPARDQSGAAVASYYVNLALWVVE